MDRGTLPQSRAEPVRISIALLDTLLTRELRAGSVETRRRARLFVAVSLGMSLVALFLSVLGSADDSLAAAVGNISFTLVLFGISFSLRLGVPLAVATQLPQMLILVGSLSFSVLSRGEYTAALFSLTVLPMISMVLAGRRSALFYAGAAMAGIAGTWWMSTTNFEPPFRVEPANWEIMRFPYIMASLGLMTGLSLVLEWLLRHAQLETRRSRAALEASEARYRGMAEHVGDLVVEFDSELCISYASPNCEAVTGWSEEKLLGRHFSKLVHPDEIARLREGFDFLRTTGEPSQASLRLLHENGSPVAYEASGNAYRSDSGVELIVCILRDVSKLRRAELALRHNERLASTGTLAAGVAHQINNPVGAILVASEYALLLAKDNDSTGVDAALRDISDNARRCGEIVRSLLQFSSHGSSERVRLDLRETISRACVLTKSHANKNGVVLDVTLEEPVYVVANAVEIEQVVVNLLCNAIESRPKSKRVSVLLTRQGDLARLSVVDDGVGIGDEDLAHIFDPFFTTRLEEGGSGLGLSVAHGIVDEHRGEIQVESAIGKGTRVTVELAAS